MDAATFKRALNKVFPSEAGLRYVGNTLNIQELSRIKRFMNGKEPVPEYVAGLLLGLAFVPDSKRREALESIQAYHREKCA